MALENIPASPWDAVFGAYESLIPATFFWIAIMLVVVGAVYMKTRSSANALVVMIATSGVFGTALPLATAQVFYIFTGVGLGGLLFLAYVGRS